MEGYQAESSLNTVFEPIMPMQPIVMPGVGESTTAAAVGQAAAMMPEAAARNLILGQVSAESLLEDAALWMGNGAAQMNYVAGRAEGQAQRGETATQQSSQQTQSAQQGGQMMMQVASQVGSQVAQLPQQLGQLVSQPVQQLSQPLQQMTQVFGQLGSSFGSPNGPQIGFLGASPMSSHPLAGGAGATSGAGLVRAASLPGMGGTATRTPMLASLVGSTESATASAEAGAGAAAGASAAGKAPVSSGSGGPMGMAGKGEKGGSTKQELKGPGTLVQDLDDEDDDW
jgi:hypothetical protein